MKKKLFFATLTLAISIAVYSNPVSVKTASEIGTKFINANTLKSHQQGMTHLDTVYYTKGGIAALYIFNSSKSFVIVAADDCVQPILGYSIEGAFDKDNIPVQLKELLHSYVEQIEYGIKERYRPSEEITLLWETVKHTGKLGNNGSRVFVEPLITTQWDQWWPYNAQCPQGSPTGCVATATGQIMNYWQYPSKGIGYHSYYQYAALFNETYYQWNIMDVNHPDVISTLLYQVGVSMSMQYTPEQSGAYLENAARGLMRYFDYSESISLFNRWENEENWVQLLKTQLLESKPVLYSGGNHAWVVDGFDEDGFFHMNFGWGGYADGYFSINHLVVGENNYNNLEQAVLDITPAYSPLTANFESIKDMEVGLTIHFYDFSKNIPNTYQWSFGDGSTSSQQNPIHQYASAGNYTVTLTVTKAGQSNSISKNVEVRDFSFFSQAQTLPEMGAGMVLDYDMDGKQDILWIDYQGSKLLRNGGWQPGIGCDWEEVDSYPEFEMSPNGIFKASPVDFQNNNAPSVLYQGMGGTKWHYYRNEGGNLVEDLSPSPCFITDEEAGLIGTYMEDDTWNNGFDLLDYNGDGLTDVVCGNLLYRNIGNGLFQPIYDVFPDGFNSFFWGCIPTKPFLVSHSIDIDRDGDLDVFSIHGIYLNQGNGTYEWRDVPSGWVTDDLNNDGWPDLVDEAIHISSGSNLDFDTRDLIFVGMAGTSSYQGEMPKRYLAHADMDNDGYIDFIGSSLFEPNDMVYSYVNNTLESVESDIDWNEWMHAWIDMDGDGSIDAIRPVRNMYEGITTLLRNVHSNNTPPTTPSNLHVETSGNTAFLHWNPSTDDHTNSGSITYNIAIGTAPGLCDVYSPLSDLATGKRFVVNKGNAGMGTVWRVNDLPNGTYYWQVQAIDQAFAASSFSSIHSFTINGGNIRPAMAPFTINCTVNEPHWLMTNDFLTHYVDRDCQALQSILITSLPTQGTVFLNGAPVHLNQSISFQDLGNMYYITESYGNDAMTVKPYDGTDYSEYETPIHFHSILFQQQFETQASSGDVAWGDYDNDGLLDFASTAGVFHNAGSSFEQLPVSIPSAETVLWADVNNDGKLDIIYDGNVLINTGNGQFNASNPLVDWALVGSSIGDFNLDNKVDYVLNGNDINVGASTRLFYNYNNAYSINHTLNTLDGFYGATMAAGDFNNDGLQDLTLSGFNILSEPQTIIYKNDDGAFISIPNDIPNVINGSMEWGDYDRDGDLDLLVSGSLNETATLVYDNYGSGIFLRRDGTSLAALSYGEAAWYDFDNDGYLDILLSGEGSGTRLYHNNNGIGFVEVIDHGLPNLTHTHIDVADCNGDGFEDIVLSGLNKDNLPYTGVFINGMGSGSKKAHGTKTVPTNLSSDVQGTSVLLSWDGQDAVSYNIYVYDSDGFVVSPLADLNNGFRKNTEAGNAGLLPSYTLRGLELGTYHWSVQAIDGSRQGSAFAAEQTFTITCDQAETVVVYDTACYAFISGSTTYYQSGVYQEYYVGSSGCDSIVERHLTINYDCSPIIYVSAMGSATNTGFSWSQALSDLQAAMDLAGALGGVVWVAQGTYYGDGVSDNAFSMPAGINVYGGFKGDELPDYDLSLRDFRLHPSILDGQHRQRTVSYDHWYLESSVIDGFTIQNGNHDDGANAYSIGGLLHITNCIVRNGTAINVGGAAHSCTLRNTLIVDNVSGGDCLNDCLMYNCTVVNNDVITSVLACNMVNCIIWHSGTSYLESNQYNWSAIEGLYTNQNVDINLASENDGTDPGVSYVRFVNPEGGDYRLSEGSSCINVGTPEIWTFELPLVDLGGTPRVIDGIIDMGAYEFDPNGIYTDLSQNDFFISLHPNPTNYALTVMANEAIKQCVVYSMTGVQVITKHFDSEEIEVNVSHLPTGIYVIRLVFDDAVKAYKFVKE